MIEIPVVNEISSTETFFSNTLNMQKELIKQYYNHPSTIIWGYANEFLVFALWKKNQEIKDSMLIYAKKLAQQLDSLALSLDPYRSTAIAGDYNPYYNETDVVNIPKVFAWNLYFGWYYHEINEFARFIDEQHKKFPHCPVMISEYGAGSADFCIPIPLLLSTIPLNSMKFFLKST
ncbi:MAG: hypothetical protein HC906_06450 [Bacteroidales bacterium]|nr:hypothetical protein [Bacteroidales bacterium]